MAIEFNPDGGKKGFVGPKGKLVKRQGAFNKTNLSEALSNPDKTIEEFFTGTGSVSSDQLREALRAKGRLPVEREKDIDTDELFRLLMTGEITHEEYTSMLAESAQDVKMDPPEEK